MLRPEEVEQLVCGCPTLDLNELRKVTFYDGGFKKDDQTIVDFWEVRKQQNIILVVISYFYKIIRLGFHLMGPRYFLSIPDTRRL